MEKKLVAKKGGGSVFVTVGTTCFDALIKSADTEEFRQALWDRGYQKLVLQIGRGQYVPKGGENGGGGLEVEHFTFAPSLAEYMKSASLVISHAGSGSIFEALRLRRALVVVVNDALMDNHQEELASELASNSYLFCARPHTLVDVVKSMDESSLEVYPEADPQQFILSLNSFLGVSD